MLKKIIKYKLSKLSKSDIIELLIFSIVIAFLDLYILITLSRTQFLHNWKIILMVDFLFGSILFYMLLLCHPIRKTFAEEKELLKQYKKIKKLELEKDKLKLQVKLQLKPLKHSFLVSLLTTGFTGFVFLVFVWLYCKFQDELIIKDVFVTKPEFHGINNDFCKLALVIFSRLPIIVFFIVGLMFCKRFFTWWDKYRDYLSLWEYHSRINDKDKQDNLLIALAPNYFGTKRNRRSDNNFMEKLLLKMIPTLNINAGGGSNNGNNGGQNGGQTT